MPNIQMPNGDVVAFPDDMPRDQIKGLISQKFPDISKTSSKPDTFDTISDNALQGATFGVGNRASAGLAALTLSGINGKPISENYKAAREVGSQRLSDEMQQNPVTAIGANLAGGLATGGLGAATKAGTAIADSLRTGNLATRIAKGALAGAASGAAYGGGTAAYDKTSEGAGSGAISGGLVGGAIPGIGAALSGVKNAILPKVTDPEIASLAKKAFDEGIPLSRSQIGDSRFAKTIASTTKSIPFSGSKGFADQQISAFNQAALRKAGITANKATPEVLSNAADNFGRRFGALTDKTTIMVGDDLLNQIATVEQEASRRLGKDATKTVGSYIDDILASGGRIDGKTYQNTRSQLGKLAKSTQDTLLSSAYKSIQKALDDAAFAALPVSGKKEWQNVRKEYGAFKTIQNAMNSSGAEAAIGNISPARLAISAKAGNPNYAKGAGELNDLARIGSAFIKDAIPDSGTAGRLAAYGTLTAGPSAILGGGVGALAVPAAGIASARGFNAINNSQRIARGALSNTGPAISPFLSAPAGGVTGEMRGSETRQPLTIPTRENLQNYQQTPSPHINLPQISPQSNASPQLFDRVIQAESRGNQSALSSKGAIGVAQIMPRTAPDAARAAGLPYNFQKLQTDPEYNAALGKAYLGKMLDRYNGNETHALIAYNWGPGNTDKWIKSGADISRLPQETKNYIQKILGT